MLGTHQHDLTRLPAVLAAFHRYRALLDRHAADPQWIEGVIRETAWIITNWVRGNRERHPELIHRWHVRAELLNLDVEAAGLAVTLPELVKLAEILTDLRWRRDVALLNTWQHKDDMHRLGLVAG